MNHEYVESQAQLTDLCDRLRSESHIYFDTEFVSEDVYLPDLCLVQIAAGDILAIIDPKRMDDMNVFWELIAGGDHVSVVHSGREEFLFCYRATGKPPANLFDTQIAGGLIGMEYPASFGNLILRLLDEKLPKGETRTDWRVRPLSSRQIEYALNDVAYLGPAAQELEKELIKLDRFSWLQEEMTSWQEALIESTQRARWRNVSGTGSLSRRSLAIVRELWKWRDNRASAANIPARRILRDDLIAELAKRKSSNLKQIRAIRGMQRSDLNRYFEEIADAIQIALDLDENDCPSSQPSWNQGKQYGVLGQFLAAALGSICREAKVAPSLACTVQDVRDLIAHHMDGAPEAPSLTQGWRAEVIGKTIEELLDGSLVVRVGDPRAVEPLAFDRRND
ncbi:HRDC domain-containing protein [Blastopirellula sp. J2-11]|uniref:ribonuclease D n=1 Tax=Blastopirellula sp. J2-11 TaxID=2943192 RepID=UPI0021C7EDF9|nr:HRDC domain-containing protein [Blastopirellula sp. J2-11]UUO08774.1 HRDC domain-containing protein [Blastopirellula sp. J2-11]